MFCAMLVVAPFFPPEDGKGDVSFTWYVTHAVMGIGVLGLAGLYWFVFAILMPRIYRYELEERLETLDDGMTVTKVVEVRNGTLVGSEEN